MKAICRDLDDIISLHNQGTLHAGRELGYVFVTNDIAVHAYGDLPIGFAATEVTVTSFSDSEMESIRDMHRSYAMQLSLALSDFSVIYSAITTNGIIISDEKILLQACTFFKVKTHTTQSFSRTIQIEKKSNPLKMKGKQT